jgi:hypothetical protein
MAQKILAVLLVLSWIVLSDVDMLEDMDLESRGTPSASSSPTTAKPVKLANDHVELANRIFEKLARSMDLKSTACTKLAAISLESGALRSHKDNCVFLI